MVTKTDAEKQAFIKKYQGSKKGMETPKMKQRKKIISWKTHMVPVEQSLYTIKILKPWNDIKRSS